MCNRPEAPLSPEGRCRHGQLDLEFGGNLRQLSHHQSHLAPFPAIWADGARASYPGSSLRWADIGEYSELQGQQQQQFLL